jgi:type I restriction enzyme, R subunit
MPYNEAETRFYLIDPKLRAKGYDDPTRLKLETPAPVDIEGPKGRRRKGPGRTDYLICIEIGPMPAPLPVGLIEAKPETADPLSGMEQGKGYGDCRRFSIHYVFATNGHRYGECKNGLFADSGTNSPQRSPPASPPRPSSRRSSASRSASLRRLSGMASARPESGRRIA